MDAFTIGCWQCTALIPGISRSGATIVGGLLRGINHEGAAHFSFLIATPIIVGATVLEVPKLLHEHVARGVLEVSLIAAVVAGITALLSTAFLMRYFRQHDSWALNRSPTTASPSALSAWVCCSWYRSRPFCEDRVVGCQQLRRLVRPCEFLLHPSPPKPAHFRAQGRAVEQVHHGVGHVPRIVRFGIQRSRTGREPALGSHRTE